MNIVSGFGDKIRDENYMNPFRDNWNSKKGKFSFIQRALYLSTRTNY